jgi:hypothetical protein
MAAIPPGCADVEQRFQTFVSTPPVTNFDDDGQMINLFDTNIMRQHIQFIKETHRVFISNNEGDGNLQEYRRWYPRRTFFHVIKHDAHEHLVMREHDIDYDDPIPEVHAAYRESKAALRTWFTEVERLHNAVVQCMPKVKPQLMGEQISRQTNLHPDVMKNIMEFANAKDPKRIVLDSAANRGVALPRGGRRRTKRTKRKGTSRAVRR